MSLEQAVLKGDIPTVSELLNTENITQDRITKLKKSIKTKKEPDDVFSLLDTSAPDTHTHYITIDKMLDNYSTVDTMDKASKYKLKIDNLKSIRGFLGGKKTKKSRKNKSKKTKSKKAKRTYKRRPRK